MLIEFSVGNYRSFKETVTFSMVAADLVSKDDKQVDENQVNENNLFAVDDKLQLLKNAVIYGANASGKSNLAQALGLMKWFMVNSSRETQSTDDINVEPFRLSTETETEPSYFELVFLMDGKKYRYGFEVNNQQVISEWLFYVPKERETRLFEREGDSFKISKTYNADEIKRITRDNALFLSVSAQFNIEIAEEILNFVDGKLNIISPFHESICLTYTVDCFINNENKKDILELVKKLDLGIDNIHVETKDLTYETLGKDIPDNIRKIALEVRKA